MSDQVVHREGNRFIIKCVRLFDEGFNVYEEVHAKGTEITGKKLNGALTYFATLDAAIKFLREAA